MMINLDKLKQMVRMIVNTREDEIGCDECFAELDRFVDLLREGQDADEILPLVQHHLDMCGDCHEEFEALLTALSAA